MTESEVLEHGRLIKEGAEWVKRQIFAAEERVTAAERERCAKISETYAGGIFYGREIAKIIRNGESAPASGTQRNDLRPGVGGPSSEEENGSEEKS
jgi:hypothetical protein